MKTIGPQPGNQTAFLQSTADITVFGGAAGCGKSVALELEPMRHLSNPKFDATILRRTSPEIRKQGGLWDESLDLYPHAGGLPLQSKLRWNFPSGASIVFGHCEYDRDVHSWHGSQIPLLCFDELQQFTEYQFWYLLSRNRSTCGVRPYVRATCNPDASSWLAKFLQWWWDSKTGYPIAARAGRLRWFVRIGGEMSWANTHDECRALFPNLSDDECRPKSVAFIPGSLSDNPALTDADPGYRANLLALPFVQRERLLHGNWRIRDTDGVEWPFEYFNDIWADSWPGSFDLVTIAVDPSKGRPNGDPSAIVMVGLSGGILWVDASISRRPPETIVADAIEFAVQYKPDGLGLESNAFQDLLEPEFDRQCAELGRPPLPVHLINNSVNKHDRIRRIGGYLKRGKVRLRQTPGCELLLDQMQGFPLPNVHDDGCFAAGTMIATPSGEQAIETINAGDMVLTRKGSRRVILAGCTGVRPVMEVSTQSGSLIGTGNHPVFDGHGFRPLHIVGTMCRCEFIRLPNPKRSRSTESCSGDIQRRSSGHTACITLPIQATVGRALGRFTKRFGKRNSGQFQTVTNYTTLMETLSITRLKTCLASRRNSTTNCIERGGQVDPSETLHTFIPCDTSPQHGTIPRLGASGTGNMPSDNGWTKNPQRLPATNAAMNTKLHFQPALNSAPLNVGSDHMPPMDGMQAASVIARRPAGIRAVYNITVDGEAEYFANGFLVHNCDAFEMAIRLMNHVADIDHEPEPDLVML